MNICVEKSVALLSMITFISSKFKLPETAYINEIPYSVIAEENAPIKTYFVPASVDKSSFLRKATRA